MSVPTHYDIEAARAKLECDIDAAARNMGDMAADPEYQAQFDLVRRLVAVRLWSLEQHASGMCANQIGVWMRQQFGALLRDIAYNLDVDPEKLASAVEAGFNDTAPVSSRVQTEIHPVEGGRA